MTNRIQVYGIDTETLPLYHKLKEVDNFVFVPQIFIPHFFDTRPYQIWRGSRYSAKSWTKALQLLVKSQEQKYFRGVFARTTQKAARDSQFQLFQDLIARNKVMKNMFAIEKTPMKIINKLTGYYIQGGSFEEPEALMSVPDITDFWAEEPISRKGSIQRAAFEDIAGTLRNSHGIVPQFHFTFNPIGKKNFIFEDFFGESPKYDQTEVNDVLANYDDNPFCPKDRIQFLQTMKKNNPTRYMVDGLGLWGNPSNDNPWFNNWDSEKHVANEQFEYGQFETYLSFDFNNNPCTCTVYQLVPGFGVKGVREYKQKGGTRMLCQKMKQDARLMEVSKFFWTVTGDSSGKNHTSTGGNINDYQIISEEFGISPSQMKVPGRNKQLVYSRRLVNECHSRIPFQISNCMTDLKNDMEIAYEDDHGNMYKDRDTGYGMDFADNHRYFWDCLCPKGMDDIDYLVKKLS